MHLHAWRGVCPRAANNSASAGECPLTLPLLVQRPAQTPDDDAARPVVGRGGNAVVDVKHEFVVLIELPHS